MPDRRKVVRGLEVCSAGKCDSCCPYKGCPRCTLQILEDALALLKAQEPMEVFSDRQCETKPLEWERCGFCPKCHQVVKWELNRAYCGFCGQELKWNE